MNRNQSKMVKEFHRKIKLIRARFSLGHKEGFAFWGRLPESVKQNVHGALQDGTLDEHFDKFYPGWRPKQPTNKVPDANATQVPQISHAEATKDLQHAMNILIDSLAKYILRAVDIAQTNHFQRTVTTLQDLFSPKTSGGAS